MPQIAGNKDSATPMPITKMAKQTSVSCWVEVAKEIELSSVGFNQRKLLMGRGTQGSSS